MANVLTPANPEWWSKTMQVIHHKKDVFRTLAEFAEGEIQNRGDTFHRPYKSNGAVLKHVRGATVPDQDITVTDQTLTVDQEATFSFLVDDFDEVQANYELATSFAEDEVTLLSNYIDGHFLYTGTQGATNVIDDGDLGGTSGNPLALTVNNFAKVFTKANQALTENNIPFTGRFAVLHASGLQVLEEMIGSRETLYGDEMTKEGILNKSLITQNGISVYFSNNVPFRRVYGIATNPSNNETLVVDGVTFTFVSSIGSTSGNVLIGASADATRANLAALINNPRATSATQVGWASTTANVATLAKLDTMVATNDDTANRITIVKKGSTFTISSTLSAVADVEVTALAGYDLLFGRMGCVSMAIQAEPKVKFQDVQSQWAQRIMGATLFGAKVFNDQAPQLVRVNVAA